MKTYFNSIVLLCVLTLIVFSLSLHAQTQTPQLLNYQGKLNNKDGTAASGVFPIVFAIYADSTGGSALWHEPQAVTIMNGVFNVLLGSILPFPDTLFTSSGARYLGTKVGADPEMKPRFRLTSVAYAFHAKSAISLSASDGDPVNAVVVDENGNVGIGTTNPSASLEIHNNLSNAFRVGVNTNAANTTAQIRGSMAAVARDASSEAFNGAVALDFYNNGSSPSWSGAYLQYFGTSYAGAKYGVTAANKGYLVFQNVGAGVIASNVHDIYISPESKVSTVFKAGGNVGIGTTNPSALLHVSSPNYSVLRIESINAGTSAQLNLKSASDGYPHILFSQGDIDRFEMGKVANNGNFYFNNNVQSGDRNAAMVISTAGHVGIGTTTPDYTLDVQGSIGGTGGLYHSSDIRWKKEIRNLSHSLDKIAELQGISFTWRKEEFPNMNFPDGRAVGFIGQDVEKVLPELVSTNQEGYKSVDYAKMSAYLVEAIKELKAENDELNKRIEKLEQK